MELYDEISFLSTTARGDTMLARIQYKRLKGGLVLTVSHLCNSLLSVYATPDVNEYIAKNLGVGQIFCGAEAYY